MNSKIPSQLKIDHIPSRPRHGTFEITVSTIDYEIKGKGLKYFLEQSKFNLSFSTTIALDRCRCRRFRNIWFSIYYFWIFGLFPFLFQFCLFSWNWRISCNLIKDGLFWIGLVFEIFSILTTITVRVVFEKFLIPDDPFFTSFEIRCLKQGSK